MAMRLVGLSVPLVSHMRNIARVRRVDGQRGVVRSVVVAHVCEDPALGGGYV
jgi:hypothetical protein